jgi:hypothetical protein
MYMFLPYVQGKNMGVIHGNKKGNYFNTCTVTILGLRQCDTSRKVAGSIPDGVTEIFH